MEMRFFQVDAFARSVFRGNPAGVCPLECWPGDGLLQGIAAENNLSETAFFVKKGPGEYDLRWFTPAVEVDLCGHATLASAYVIFRFLEPDLASVTFHTRSGPLTVERRGELLVMDFPSRPAEPVEAPPDLVRGLGVQPAEVLRSRDYLAVLGSEDDVARLAPDMEALARLECVGVIATAPGTGCDFVSRFFAPRVGVPEDPVTGSAHCTLVPYWAARLGLGRLRARQISARGGELECELRGDRVRIGGHAALYLEGTLHV